MARVPLLVLVPPVAFAALAGLFAASLWRDDGNELPSQLVGQQAPALPTEALPGLPPLDPAVLADGEVKLVNFWASWCPPCRVEHPQLMTLAAEGVPIYGINYKDLPDNALAFIRDLGNPYAALGADPSGRFGLDWGVYGLPETFVIAGDGTVVARMATPLTPRALEERLRPALAQAAAR